MTFFKKFTKKIIISIIFSAFIYLLFSVIVDFDKVLESFKEFRWYFLLFLLLSSLVNYLIRFLRWEYYLSLLSISIPKRTSFIIFLSGFSMTMTPGKAGEVVKSLLLKMKHNVSISESAPIVLAERVTDFIALIILSLVGILQFTSSLKYIIITAIFIFLLIVSISYSQFALFIINLIGKIDKLKNFSDKILVTYTSSKKLLTPYSIIYATFFSVIAWFFECLGFYITFLGFTTQDISVSLLNATFIYSFSTIVGALSFLPGGVGATEGSMALFLTKYLTISQSKGVASVFIIRLATLWFAIFLGILVLFIYRNQFNFSSENSQS